MCVSFVYLREKLIKLPRIWKVDFEIYTYIDFQKKNKIIIYVLSEGGTQRIYTQFLVCVLYILLFINTKFIFLYFYNTFNDV